MEKAHVGIVFAKVFAKTHTGATNIGLILLEVIGSVDVAGLVAHLFFFGVWKRRRSVRLRAPFCFLHARCAASRAMAKCLLARRGLFHLEHFQRGLEYVQKKAQYISSACVPDVVSFIL